MPFKVIANVLNQNMKPRHDLLKQVSNTLIVLFVETPRKFITAKLSIRKPGSSSVLIIICIINNILLALMKIRAYGSKALQ
jgi:hypothetical protein